MTEEPHSHGAAQGRVDTADTLGSPALSRGPRAAGTNGGVLSVPASLLPSLS